MSIFIDATSRVDREGLRLFVLAQMQKSKQLAEGLCIERREFWDRLMVAASTHLFANERTQSERVIDQLAHLPQFIDTWITTALDTQERFDFFVMTKAHELHSTDQQRDYYWALQIRHDQLVGLVRVVELLLDKMKLWMSLRPYEVFSDPVFAGLTECDIEKQIYLEAERIYKERQSMTDGQHENHVSSP